MCGRNALRSCRGKALRVKVRHKTDASTLSALGNGDVLSSFAIPGPKVLHALPDVHAYFSLARDHIDVYHPTIQCG